MPSVLSFLVLSLLLAIPPAVSAAEAPANSIFLVARRDMPDPNFRETVVLVTQPRRGGPFGVIINRPLEQRLSDLLSEFESLKEREDVVYFGGPVKPAGLVFLVRATTPPPRGISVLKDVYFTGDTDLIEKLLQRPHPTQGLKVFAGYSGWGLGQLQREIKRGDWHIMPADAAMVFEKDASRIWPELIKRTGVRKTRHSPKTLTADKRGSIYTKGRNPKPRAEPLAADERRYTPIRSETNIHHKKEKQFVRESGAACQLRNVRDVPVFN
ncbi:MAG: YqgE/AlgH family protein [Gammaproteobacteria bacterium]|nr:YqgE/AlgH family protein [Gammaproteobacteria bacterium]MDH3411473.1 YqgE/AlgH family protein [Gammaproteobacteria bacterium]